MTRHFSLFPSARESFDIDVQFWIFPNWKSKKQLKRMIKAYKPPTHDRV